jgi:hypothetical protein
VQLGTKKHITVVLLLPSPYLQDGKMRENETPREGRNTVSSRRETGRLGVGEWETGRLGDWETGRLGDWEGTEGRRGI